MSDEIDVKRWKRVVISPQRIQRERAFANLREVEMTGALVEQKLFARMRAYGEERGLTLGKIRTEWVCYISAYGWQMPEEMLPTQEDAARLGVPLEEEQARARARWAEAVTIAEVGRQQTIVLDVPDRQPESEPDEAPADLAKAVERERRQT